VKLKETIVPVPSSVKQYLDHQNVRYNIANLVLQNFEWTLENPNPEDIPTVKSAILKDGLGKVQVLYPADSLLDLNVLNQELTRQLRATSHDDLRSFYDQYQLESVPALPKLSGLPTVVDVRLLLSESLYLDSGTSDQLLQLDQREFQQVIGEAAQLDFAVPLAKLQPTANGNDETQILDAVKNFTSLRIKQRLEETLELPPLPNTAQKIIALRVNPNADINDLAGVVETDPSLAAQVVSWAASPYYSAPGKIKSIHDAIVRVLGFDMVLNLSLGLALGRSMNLPKDCPRGITPYWQQAVYTAAAVESLVSAIPRDHRPGVGMAYLSGLLHNFGLLVLAEIFPPHFEMINRFVEANPNVNHQTIERHLIGITRDQLAAWLMRVWHMPEEVETAIRYQGQPNFSGHNNEYAKLLFIAANKLRERSIGLGPVKEIPSSLYESLHLNPNAIEKCIDDIMDSAEELNVIAQQMGD
jgi:HD-like signal output (HDOD) protein/prolyl-tRNA editing enzyme YbaK/EbsC (Cys-tRNA(Pro) deacylase)